MNLSKLWTFIEKKTDQQPTEMRYVSSNKSSIIALLLKLNLFLSQIIWSAPAGRNVSAGIAGFPQWREVAGIVHISRAGNNVEEYLLHPFLAKACSIHTRPLFGRIFFLRKSNSRSYQYMLLIEIKDKINDDMLIRDILSHRTGSMYGFFTYMDPVSEKWPHEQGEL